MKALFSRPAITGLVGVLLTALLLSIMSIRLVWQETVTQRFAGMQSMAEMARTIVGADSASNWAHLDSIAHYLGKLTGCRFTIIGSDGRVLGDSEADFALMENHSDRPEFVEAVQGRIGTRTRLSPTLSEMMMYLALPPGSLSAPVVRISAAALSYRAFASNALPSVTFLSLLSLLLVLILAYLLQRPISDGLQDLRLAFEAIAAGRLEHRVPISGIRSLKPLEESLNWMTEQFSLHLEDVTRQRNELEAVLSSMVEGVLAIDREERIISANGAARRLLGIEPGSVSGKTLQETIRNRDLQQFVTLLLNSPGFLEDEIIIGDGQMHLQLHGSLIYDLNGQLHGAVVVLHDVTRLRRLEIVRKDFVANVSHELRTPITSIKGFVETLNDGAIEDQTSARKFLEIISRQVDRLNAIIEDLLVLARLEQEEGSGLVDLVPQQVGAVLKSVVEICEPHAKAKRITLTINEGGELIALLNPQLLEQALVNLIENAINYSGPDTTVMMSARQEGSTVILSVTDQGQGIAPEHLPRLFERFYRIDRDRSRKLGGTGLGLAIVKHIAKAHRGKVTVVSAVGRGSTFSIHLQSAHNAQTPDFSS